MPPPSFLCELNWGSWFRGIAGQGCSKSLSGIVSLILIGSRSLYDGQKCCWHKTVVFIADLRSLPLRAGSRGGGAGGKLEKQRKTCESRVWINGPFEFWYFCQVRVERTVTLPRVWRAAASGGGRVAAVTVAGRFISTMSSNTLRFFTASSSPRRQERIALIKMPKSNNYSS